VDNAPLPGQALRTGTRCRPQVSIDLPCRDLCRKRIRLRRPGDRKRLEKGLSFAYHFSQHGDCFVLKLDATTEQRGERIVGFDLAGFHLAHRERILQEWIDRLRTEVGDRYAERPRRELQGTVSEALDAYYHVLANNDFGPINAFIDKITRMRLEAGFQLSLVQKAFELYRSIILRLMVPHTAVEEFCDAAQSVNRCLAYTIHRFSDHFQHMHERQILEHNRRLEEKVRARTAELRESQLKYKTLVEEITDGYFVVQDEEIVFANQAFCRMHGMALEEVLGSKYFSHVAPEDRDRVMQIHDRSIARKSETPRSFEYNRITRDGSRYPTEILAKVTLFDHKLSNIGICRDITERIKMEERMREAEKMAYIGQITTSLSHEIRNPLSSIKMNLQILKKNERLDGNDQRRIDISAKEMVRLESILKELLDFAKPLQLRFVPADINRLIASSAELLDMKLTEKRLHLAQSLAPDLPALRIDPEKLEQVLINLLINAAEASQEGGEISVRTGLVSLDGSEVAEIAVEDTGHGLPVDAEEEIFRPFYTTKSKGTGLGLANVKRIVEAHGGWVEAGNRSLRGCSFKAFLPLRDAEHGQDPDR
jgi:PAS domain S-box-containing protein